LSCFVEASTPQLGLISAITLTFAIGDLNLENLWTAVTLLQGIRHCSPAARLGLVNLLELIWGSEEQSDHASM
jgi:hypothetical protein